jgi:hypothetical protein
VNIWYRIRDFAARQFVLPLKPTREQFTISAIKQLPAAAPPLKDEITREKRNSVPSTPRPAEGRTCPACGATTKIKILNYWCDPVTDIITPADTIEQCDCGWASAIVEHERPL